MNPIEYIRQNTSEQFHQKLAEYLSIDPSAAWKIQNEFTSCLVSRLIQNCGDRDQLNRIWDFIRDPAMSGWYGTKLVAEKGGTVIMQSILQFVTEIFGKQWDQIQSQLIRHTDLPANNKLEIGFVELSAVVFSALQKKSVEEGFGSDQFATWIANEKTKIFAVVPPDLADTMNLTSTQVKVELSEDTAVYSSYWWIWLVGVLLLLTGIFTGLKKCKRDTTGPVKSEIKEVDPYKTLDLVTRTKWENLGFKINYRLPDGNEYEFPDKGVEFKIISYIDQPNTTGEEIKWFDFDRILFNTGSSELNPASLDQLTGIFKILRAYPTVHVKIGGYTDNVGDPASNLKLSQSRAERVVQELIRMGISSNRLEAEGYGDQHPVGDNNTPEGRETNRRVSLRLTKR
ncbi:MAG: OmpA family protein [Saprospiraceae bacterium]|nr:OmpA family protein [Saprospiraceae bacterium]